MIEVYNEGFRSKRMGVFFFFSVVHVNGVVRETWNFKGTFSRVYGCKYTHTTCKHTRVRKIPFGRIFLLYLTDERRTFLRRKACKRIAEERRRERGSEDGVGKNVWEGFSPWSSTWQVYATLSFHNATKFFNINMYYVILYCVRFGRDAGVGGGRVKHTPVWMFTSPEKTLPYSIQIEI